MTASPGPASAVSAEVGLGPAGTDPRTDGGWHFVSATWNNQTLNDDEYFGTLTAPAPGSYSYAYRFSLDGWATTTYCDADAGGAGSNPGATFSPEALGTMTVTP